MRRTVLALGALSSIVLVFVLPQTGAGADPGGGGCQLAGSAAFTPNGPGATDTFSYGVNAQLTGCQSNVSGAPTGGTLAVGQHVVETVTIQTPTGPQQVQATYAEPLATGAGAVPGNSCAAGSTAGTGVVTWADNSTTVVSYTTSSVGPAVPLQGTVVPSVTLTLVSGPAGSPATFTISSTNPLYPAGDGAVGLVTFTTSDPTPCTTAAGLSSVDLQGFVGIGATS